MWQEKDRQMFLNTAGNSAMAKAGSGDVLAGVITGLLAQHMKVYEGTVLGVYLHACGGDAARERRGAYSVLAEDLTEGIAACIKRQKREIMMEKHSRVYAEIDLDAISYNMEQMKKRVGEGAKLLP